jgi:hypothetical protein
MGNVADRWFMGRTLVTRARNPLGGNALPRPPVFPSRRSPFLDNFWFADNSLRKNGLHSKRTFIGIDPRLTFGSE